MRCGRKSVITKVLLRCLEQITKAAFPLPQGTALLIAVIIYFAKLHQ